ncbi:vesicle coat protein [Xylogone sp. PMI_703]|nr:vesicle coat protein [Xylogone sp. PMI_703]
MVTEALPVGCTSCFHADESDAPSTRRHSTSTRSDSIAGTAASPWSPADSQASDKDSGLRGTDLQLQNFRIGATTSPLETPPESPRIRALQSGQLSSAQRRDSSFRKTYDENDRKRAIPCENCALTLPKKTKEEVPTTPTGKSRKIDNSGPILRTRKAYERVSFVAEAPSPPKSQSDDSSDSGESDKNVLQRPRRRSGELKRTGTSSSNSSTSLDSTLSHTHYLDYTSTHEPLVPSSFSLVRQSCLRTLSCETLPPSMTSSTTSSPTSPFTTGPYSSSISTSSGGPIFFGDPMAGYTTAYIFRIPDPTARGRRRVYALMALSTHHERLAMQSFSFLSAAFRELAAWIQSLAETELERSENSNSPFRDTADGRSAFISHSARDSNGTSTPTSSFLSGRNRGMDGKFMGMSIRARGLAELVGLPDFFIELHARFVRLLIELGVLLGA